MRKEIINAYTELNDPVVQRERFQQQAKVSHILITESSSQYLKKKRLYLWFI